MAKHVARKLIARHTKERGPSPPKVQQITETNPRQSKKKELGKLEYREPLLRPQWQASHLRLLNTISNDAYLSYYNLFFCCITFLERTHIVSNKAHNFYLDTL
jgi:hypothetical protein